MRKFIWIPVAIICLLGWVCLPVALAEDLKARFIERLPQINALKDQGLIGENNAGLLEYRTNQRPQAAMIDAENSDRRKVYEAIAKQQGVSAEVVGQRRALQIREKAAGGEWLQDENGTWYRK